MRAILKEMPIVLVDIGASGDMVEPWASVAKLAPEALQVIGFEPDKTECALLNAGAANNSNTPQMRFIPTALWRSNGPLELHVAERGSTSSVYPPNWDFLKVFETPHWVPRKTKAVLELSALALDEATKVHGFKPDFLKIDTQGSEYEILQGARDVLETQCMGCTLETWTGPVHSGQKLSFEIMRYMHDIGYRLFDIERTAVWQRAQNAELKANRGELVGFDLLYFADPETIKRRTAPEVIKAAVIFDLWGYRRLAMSLLEGVEKNHTDYRDRAAVIRKTICALDRHVRIRPQSRLGLFFDRIVSKALSLRPFFLIYIKLREA